MSKSLLVCISDTRESSELQAEKELEELVL
jgi:hypothetical protein